MVEECNIDREKKLLKIFHFGFIVEITNEVIVVIEIARKMVAYIKQMKRDMFEKKDLGYLEEMKEVAIKRLTMSLYLLMNKSYYSEASDDINYVSKENTEFDDDIDDNLRKYPNYHYDIYTKNYAENKPIQEYKESLTSNAMEVIVETRQLEDIEKYVVWFTKTTQSSTVELMCCAIFLYRLCKIDDKFLAYLKTRFDLLLPTLLIICKKMYTCDKTLTNKHYATFLHLNLNDLNSLEIAIFMKVNILIKYIEYGRFVERSHKIIENIYHKKIDISQ
jgi:hypothetical protein